MISNRQKMMIHILNQLNFFKTNIDPSLDMFNKFHKYDTKSN